MIRTALLENSQLFSIFVSTLIFYCKSRGCCGSNFLRRSLWQKSNQCFLLLWHLVSLTLTRCLYKSVTPTLRIKLSTENWWPCQCGLDKRPGSVLPWQRLEFVLIKKENFKKMLLEKKKVQNVFRLFGLIKKLSTSLQLSIKRKINLNSAFYLLWN